MSYLTQKQYSLDRPVLFNNLNVNNLVGSYIKPSNLSSVGGYKKVLAGSWLTTSDRLLDRAIAISPYTAGQTKVAVNNPWAFLPGDVLHIIGDSSENYMAEKNAVELQSAPTFGTVVSVDAGVNPMLTTITPSNVAVGDIFNLKIEETVISVIADSTNVADVIQGFYDQLVTYMQQAHHSTIEGLKIKNNGTNLTLQAKEPGQIFVTTGSVVGSGSQAIAVSEGIGTLNITVGSGNANLAIGSKIGSINKPGIGIIANTLYLTDQDNLERVADYAAYDAGNIFKKSLTYLDGALVAANQTLKYMSPYGH
jgi:hypothetical protein